MKRLAAILAIAISIIVLLYLQGPPPTAAGDCRSGELECEPETLPREEEAGTDSWASNKEMGNYLEEDSAAVGATVAAAARDGQTATSWPAQRAPARTANGDTLPANCQAIRDADPTAADGDYTIYPNGMAFQVYCHDMAGQPKEYLSLINTGGDYNFSQYTAGGASPGTNVRTNFTKVRLDPATLAVDIGDLAFATSSGALLHGREQVPITEVAYGAAVDCIALFSQTGLGNIDLRGTPFVISDTFVLTGWFPGGQATVGARGQVADLQGGGYPGFIGPAPEDNFWKTVRPLDFTDDYRLDLRHMGVIYVDEDATGANNGSSWANAYDDLQDALGAALSGSEIWVAEGRYTPGEEANESFYLLEDVAIYGGFAGWETRRSQRDWQTNVTVLSGDIAGDDSTDVNGIITDTANISGTNAYHVVRSNYLTENAILDGFTVNGGAALSNSWPDYMGGGMSNDQSRPTLANLVFRGNMASIYGGGLYNNASNPTLHNVTFRDNAAVGMTGADGYGGGLYNNVGSSPTLKDVTFLDNTATGYGGGMRNWYESNPKLVDVTFQGNSAGIYGGGLGNRDNSRPTLIDVTFIENTASLGGGMANQDNSANMANVMFNGNSADYGGGMYTEGLYYVSVVKVTNAVFSGNRAEYDGGAIENRGSLLELRQVTLANNQAQGNGGGLNIFATAVPSLTIDIYNSIFWGNTATTGAQLFNASPAALASLDHVLIQDGCPADVSCSAYVVADPLFRDAAGPDGLVGTWDDDLRLQALSPAVDTGDDSLLPVDELDLDADGVTYGELLPVDLLGYSRIYGISVDMGACERQEFYQHLPVILK